MGAGKIKNAIYDNSINFSVMPVRLFGQQRR